MLVLQIKNGKKQNKKKIFFQKDVIPGSKTKQFVTQILKGIKFHYLQKAPLQNDSHVTSLNVNHNAVT